MAEAPYKLSRAALRERWGSRSIDARAPQSALDTTPSGREAFARQRGKTERQAEDYAADKFRQAFPKRMDLNRGNLFLGNPNIKGMFSSPEEIDRIIGGGNQFNAPQPQQFASLNLLPPSNLPATDLAPFLPNTATPLSNFSLPRLNRPQRWDTSIYG